MSEVIFKEEKDITQHDVENKQLKEVNGKVRKEENEKVESRKVESRKKKKEKVESRKVESTKRENEKVRKEQNEQLKKKNVDAKIKESVEKPIEIKSPEEDKNTTDWFDRNKFKEILAITDSNKFNYRNKIGEFKYIDIRDLVNNIRNNKIGEISAKKGFNTLNEIKKCRNNKI